MFPPIEGWTKDPEVIRLYNADQLNAEGKHLYRLGHLVVFLHPSQEWMAVEMQVPFLRYERISP